MTELNELYQELILDHGKTPRNFGVLKNADHTANGNNPLCGDKLKLYLIIDNDIIKDIMFDGIGCAISMASASMMTDIVKNKTTSEVKDIFKFFHNMVTDNPENTNFNDHTLDKLTALSGVKDYPMRVKCATLPWHTLNAAIENSANEIKTE